MSKRKISVVLIDNLDSPITSNLATMCPKIDIPNGFSLEGGERKFIVLMGKDELVIIIGPIGTYYHKKILAISRHNFGHLEISGGGSITFRCRCGTWQAEFKDNSGDFGVFDPLILEKSARKIIQKNLGMTTLFSWFERELGF